MEVYLPSPSTARLKMPPHITDVQRPHSVRNMTPMGTSIMAKPVPVNTGMRPIVSIGAKMPSSTKTSATTETAVSCALLETLPPMTPPIRRPHIIRNQ